MVMKPIINGVLVSLRAWRALVKVLVTAWGAIARLRKARALPVSRVASQGKFLAPKARRTKGILRTRTRTLAGRAKKRICRMDLLRVALNLDLSSKRASWARVGKEAWLRETPKREMGRT